MKKLLIILAIISIAKPVFAQNSDVTRDENNKYIYYHIADTAGLTADTMYNRVLTGFKKNKHAGAFKFTIATSPVIEVSSKLPIYSSLTIVKHEDAEIAFMLHAEFKADKYRYWLTNFIYKPYKRNRYGIYERVKGEEVPLEEAAVKFDKRTLELYLTQIANYSKQVGEEMAAAIKKNEKSGVLPIKVDTRKW